MLVYTVYVCIYTYGYGYGYRYVYVQYICMYEYILYVQYSINQWCSNGPIWPPKVTYGHDGHRLSNVYRNQGCCSIYSLYAKIVICEY